jgi:phosphonate transport system substrate-binding protein
MGDGVLRVGVAQTVTATRSVITPRPAERTAQHLDAFCRALGAALNRTAVPETVDSYPALVDAMHAGKLDLAWLPPVVALRAASVGRALPVAMPVRHGVSSFHTALFARKGTKLHELRDIFGARAAWVDRSSAAGYLVIRAALRSKGLGFENAFASEAFVGSHDAVAKAVTKGEADVGATYVYVNADGSIWRAGWGDADVQMITKVGPIPSDLIAASANMPRELLCEIQRAIVSGEDRDLARAAGQLLEADSFVEAEARHLEPLTPLLRFLEEAPQRMPSIFPRGRSSSPPSRAVTPSSRRRGT